MSLPFVLEALRRRIALIAIVTLVVAAGGIVLGDWWPKTYTSSAQVMLGLDAANRPAIDAQSGNLYLRERVATYAQTVKADEVVEPVATAAGVSPQLLRRHISVAIVPETVVLEISVSASTPAEAVVLTNAVSRRFSTQVSALNVETGGPEIVAAQFSSPQPATEPDQLNGWLLVAVSSLVGLLLGVLLALLLAALKAVRSTAKSTKRADADRNQLTGHGADWDGWEADQKPHAQVAEAKSAADSPTQGGSSGSYAPQS